MCTQVRWEPAEGGGRPNLVEVPDSSEVLEADLVLLAMGFLGPEATLAQALGIELDPRSNFKARFGGSDKSSNLGWHHIENMPFFSTVMLLKALLAGASPISEP